MKKAILLSLTSILLASSAYAQDSKAEEIFKKYRFGLFVGPTFNSLKPTADKASSSGEGTYAVSKEGGRTGFSVGLNAELNMNTKYTLYSGIGLDWNGGSIQAVHDSTTTLDPDYATGASIGYRTQYLAIPLGLKMYAFEVADFKIFAQTGIDVSVLLSQKGDYTLTGPNVTSTSDENVKLNDYARVTPVNVGWHVGVGAEYGLANGSAVYASILYRNGFSDVTTPKLNAKGNRFVDGNIRSNAIAIRIGYFF